LFFFFCSFKKDVKNFNKIFSINFYFEIPLCNVWFIFFTDLSRTRLNTSEKIFWPSFFFHGVNLIRFVNLFFSYFWDFKLSNKLNCRARLKWEKSLISSLGALTRNFENRVGIVFHKLWAVSFVVTVNDLPNGAADTAGRINWVVRRKGACRRGRGSVGHRPDSGRYDELINRWVGRWYTDKAQRKCERDDSINPVAVEGAWLIGINRCGAARPCYRCGQVAARCCVRLGHRGVGGIRRAALHGEIKMSRQRALCSCLRNVQRSTSKAEPFVVLLLLSTYTTFLRLTML